MTPISRYRLTARALHEQHVGGAADQPSQPDKREPVIEVETVIVSRAALKVPTVNSKPFLRFCLSGRRLDSGNKPTMRVWIGGQL